MMILQVFRTAIAIFLIGFLVDTFFLALDRFYSYDRDVYIAALYFLKKFNFCIQESG